MHRAFKYWRAKAIVYVLSNFALLAGQKKVWWNVLQLGAMMVYMLNALIYLPSEQAQDIPLYTHSAHWSFPDAEEYDDDDAFLNDDRAGHPVLEVRGAYFLSEVHYTPNAFVLPTSLARDLTSTQICIHFEVGSWAALQDMFGSSLVEHRSRTIEEVRDVRRRPFRTDVRLRTKLLKLWRAEEWNAPALSRWLLCLALIPRQDRGPEGSDAVRREEAEASCLMEFGSDLPQIFRNFQFQWEFDVLELAPQPHTSRRNSYLTMTKTERRNFSREDFRRLGLPFTAVWVIVASPDEWKDHAMCNFPSKAQLRTTHVPHEQDQRRKSSAIQGWTALMNRISDDPTAKLVQKIFIQKYWNTMHWAPYGTPTQLYHVHTPTSANAKYLTQTTNAADFSSAPVILLNPAFHTVNAVENVRLLQPTCGRPLTMADNMSEDEETVCDAEEEDGTLRFALPGGPPVIDVVNDEDYNNRWVEDSAEPKKAGTPPGVPYDRIPLSTPAEMPVAAPATPSDLIARANIQLAERQSLGARILRDPRVKRYSATPAVKALAVVEPVKLLGNDERKARTLKTEMQTESPVLDMLKLTGQVPRDSNINDHRGRIFNILHDGDSDDEIQCLGYGIGDPRPSLRSPTRASKPTT